MGCRQKAVHEHRGSIPVKDQGEELGRSTASLQLFAFSQKFSLWKLYLVVVLREKSEAS